MFAKKACFDESVLSFQSQNMYFFKSIQTVFMVLWISSTVVLSVPFDETHSMNTNAHGNLRVFRLAFVLVVLSGKAPTGNKNIRFLGKPNDISRFQMSQAGGMHF